MDGVDAVLCDISENSVQTLDCVSYPYPTPLLTILHSLCSPGSEEINLMGSADRAVADTFARAVNRLLEKNHLAPDDIVALGSHGQTVRHHPNGVAVHRGASTFGFTLQIGDPNTLAILTGIDVISDFRRKDIALGGEGAPLVPAFHQAVFAREQASRTVVNIGGIANISVLAPKHNSQGVTGFDTGPGNTLMDAWCWQHTGKPYDEGGLWAAGGTPDNRLLRRMLDDPYFHRNGPKSTGREYFNLTWLHDVITPLVIAPQDVQASLLSLTATSISDAVRSQPSSGDIIVCGGGAFNHTLMDALSRALPECQISTSETVGIHPQWVEGAAFAWLAYAFTQKIPGNVPAVTGASRPAVLGTLTPAS